MANDSQTQTATQYHEQNVYRLLNRPVGQDCVLDIRFLEGTGTTVKDISGYGNDATVTLDGSQSESQFWGDGLFGAFAADLYGFETHLEVPHDSSLNVGKNFTIEYLVEADWQESNNQFVFQKLDQYQSWSGQGLGVNLTASGVGGSNAHSAWLGNGDLVHVVFTQINDEVRLWVHAGDGGMAYVSDSAASAPDTTTNDLWIGAREEFSGSGWLDGKIHFFRIYDRSFGREEIRSGISTPYQQGLLKKQTAWHDDSDTEQIVIDPDAQQVDLKGSSVLKDPSNSSTADSMTADPESAAEDGYIEVNIGGTTYQVPIYQS